MKRVPGATEAPQREEQLRQLLTKLAGHEAFGRLRGTFGPEDTKRRHLTGLVAGSQTPTAFCREWDQYSADVRVLGSMLAQFRRDGWDSAARELELALMLLGYTLPGEEVPLNETVPLTALIVDFPRTYAMISWIRAAHWMDLDRFLDGDSVNPLTTNLFDQFPSLQAHTVLRRKWGSYEGGDLLAAYRDDVLHPFLREAFGLEYSANERPKSFLSEAKTMEVGNGTYNDHLELSHNALGYLFQDDQAAVLSRIPREHQNRVSTFSFRAPKIVVEALNQGEYKWRQTLTVGFHPEERHGDWSNTGGACPSKGCAHGFGTVLLDKRRHDRNSHLSRYNNLRRDGSVTGYNEGDQVAFILQPW